MSDNKKRIKLQRYEWPDEVIARKKKRTNTIIKLTIVILLLIAMTLGGYFVGINKAQNIANGIYGYNDGNKVTTVADILSNQWYFADEIENIEDTLIDQALVGMTTLENDPHTAYMSSEQIQEFFASINNDFVGIGVRVRNYGSYLVVESVFKNSPAEASGIVKGDIIFSVDGENVSDHEYEEIIDMIKGEANTKVSLGIIRDGQKIGVDVVRQQVNTTVDGEMIDEAIAYIELSSFGELTCDQMITYLDEFTAQGASKLMLDLRGDGGGHLGSVVDIGSLFIAKDKVILEQENADGTIVQYKSAGKRHYSFEQIVILVNQATASAAEVLTLALKQQVDNVFIVGTTTYGKGTIQSTVYLEDGSALKYTTSKWNAPDGSNINNVGIQPDVVVELPDIITTPYIELQDKETAVYDSVSAINVQLQKGLRYLGYDVAREDGYFDQTTLTALQQFEADNELTVDGIYDKADNEKMFLMISEKWTQEESDIQKTAALELLQQQ
ncbi:MAG: S41 family peptidase [Erysipelotrichaceae bacterium]|nr:S41 family peptidase [Erysipelotrichaceae bacterium]MDY5251900.1 S41 family peptidase [Erysipelotrichaceae bacterium]